MFPTRQEKLKAYLAVHGPSLAELSRRLNVSKVRARQICLAERVREKSLEVMKAAGIPSELLPGEAMR